MADNSTIPVMLDQFFARMQSLVLTTDRLAPAYDAEVRRAVEMKRSGHYAESVAGYLALAERMGAVHTGMMSSLYKTVAVAGYLGDAATILAISERIYQANPAKPPLGLDLGEELVSFFVEHWRRLSTAVASPQALHQYLHPLSGDPDYRLPRSYEQMIQDYRLAVEGPRTDSSESPPPATNLASSSSTATRNGNATERSTKPASGGACYIATAVYGSYDAPEVVVLRRFRDQRLATSAAGRAFVRTYYSVSPPLASHLARASVLNRAARRVLDRIVRRVRDMPLDNDDSD